VPFDGALGADGQGYLLARAFTHPAFEGSSKPVRPGAHLQALWTNGDQVARLIARRDIGEGCCS